MNFKKLLNSFKYAFCGICSAFKSEQNMKIHFTIMVLVVLFGIFLKINIQEWIVCIFCFTIVIGGEIINTAIEKTVDLAMPEKHELAKLAKDMSAGAVLIFALGSLIIGLLIFIPKIIPIFS